MDKCNLKQGTPVHTYTRKRKNAQHNIETISSVHIATVPFPGGRRSHTSREINRQACLRMEPTVDYRSTRRSTRRSDVSDWASLLSARPTLGLLKFWQGRLESSFRIMTLVRKKKLVKGSKVPFCVAIGNLLRHHGVRCYLAGQSERDQRYD